MSENSQPKGSSIGDWIVRGIALIFLGLLVFVIVDIQDSHHANIRHIGWKWGILPYDRDTVLRFLNVDVSFRDSLLGKTRSELETWFPKLALPDEEQLQNYPILKTLEALSLDHSHWFLIFKNGKLVDFICLKG